MLEVVDLKVRSLDLDLHDVTWALAPTRQDVYDFTFSVYRSESPEGPYDLIGGPFEDRYRFVDRQLQIAHRWRQYWYRIRVVDKRNDETVDYGPASMQPEPDLHGAEIRRHVQLLMQEFAGRRLWVLPIRTFGPRCDCWDDTLQKRTRSGCKTCFDTGFVRGYLAPIETFAQIDPSPKSEQRTNVGVQHQSNTTGRFPWYPPMKPDDLVVEAENRRWRVTTVVQTEKGRAPIHQEIQLHEIPKKDIEFAVPLDMSTALKDLWISPQRNFTNPTNFASYESDIVPTVFRLYQKRRST